MKKSEESKSAASRQEEAEPKVSLWVRIHTYSEQKPGPFIAMLMGFGVLSWVAGSLLTGDIMIG